MNKGLNHILCVDDENDILEIASMCLETVGNFTVTRCVSGHDALKTIEKMTPDMILLDVMMPEMDGPTTFKRLRDKAELQKIPIVFMTARVQRTEIEEYLRIGASGVLEKPFDPMTLSDQVLSIWKKFHGF